MYSVLGRGALMYRGWRMVVDDVFGYVFVVFAYLFMFRLVGFWLLPVVNIDIGFEYGYLVKSICCSELLFWILLLLSTCSLWLFDLCQLWARVQAWFRYELFPLLFCVILISCSFDLWISFVDLLKNYIYIDIYIYITNFTKLNLWSSKPCRKTFYPLSILLRNIIISKDLKIFDLGDFACSKCMFFPQPTYDKDVIAF